MNPKKLGNLSQENCYIDMKETNQNKENFQPCAHLEVEDLYSKSENTLADLLNLQKDIQETVYGYDFNEMRRDNKKLLEFFKWNDIAIKDEQMEALNALSGMSVRPKAWKPWKKTHQAFLNSSFNELSDDDKKELQMELIDELHFLFNKMIAVDINPEALYNYYFAKNKENRDRQKRGY